MATKPTNYSPEQPTEPTTAAESGLTPEQADGMACVRCSRDFTTYSGPTIPVATVNGGQVFACVSCVDEKGVAEINTPGGEKGVATADTPGGSGSVREADGTLISNEGAHNVGTPAGEPSPVAPTSAMWPAGEPESVRQAAQWADITTQIREITELIRPVVDERYGHGTGVLLAELVEALLSGRIEVEQFTTLSEALQRGERTEVEQAVTR